MLRLGFLGHAGFCLEDNAFVLAMDPWLSPDGAYDSSWFQFPRNHHLAAPLRTKLADPSRQRFIYLSHDHKDHYDPDFLRSVDKSVTMVLPRFRNDHLERGVRALGFSSVRILEHGESIALPSGNLTLFIDDDELSRDSAILVDVGGTTFLNLNDCKLFDALPAIARSVPKIDVFTAQFSGATWHPTCYDYPREEYERISKKKVVGKFAQIARAIEEIRPRIYIPSAGPPCFLDPKLQALNFESTNIFPRASVFVPWLQTRLKKTAVQISAIRPGDELDPISGDLRRAPDDGSDGDLHAYIQRYAADYTQRFDTLTRPLDPSRAESVFNRLGEELRLKLAAFSAASNVPLPLHFGITDLSSWWKVDFPNRKVERVEAAPEGTRYTIVAPGWEVARILDGELSWEDFALTFRARLMRVPDVYRTEIAGFLMLERDAMSWFCERLQEIQNRKDRLRVEAPCGKFDVDRYCPHQGADLSHGWVEEGHLFVCPRHRWQFDLLQDGRCLTSAGSIDAKALPSGDKS